MEWYGIVSYSITNAVRIFMCLLTAETLLGLPRMGRRAVGVSLSLGIAIAVLSLAPAPELAVSLLEAAVIIGVLYLQCRSAIRMCAFLTVFFEIGVGLWDFLVSACFAFFTQNHVSSQAMEQTDISAAALAWEHLAAVWTVRLLMVVFALFIARREEETVKILQRFLSFFAAFGMLCAVALTQWRIVSLPDEAVASWVILSAVLLVAVLFYRLNRQYEMEREIAALKTERLETMERDYQNLNKAYSANARLYHDLHNHLAALHSYLSQEETENALRYIEDLQASSRNMAQDAWTGDEAVDYLISSKIAGLEQRGVEVRVNIEFPRHTNIKSADLIAILGNLLDNALEALNCADGSPCFLHLTIRRINEMLVIKVENSCDMEPDFDGTEVKTTKSKNGLHGWGLKSARTAAEKYDGTLETSYEKKTDGGGVFCVVATVCF